MDRTLGSGKPVDPATRLSELLAQSLEELTRPFDAPRSGAQPEKPAGAHGDAAAAAQPLSPEAAAHDLLPKEEVEPTPEETRIDADKALAELEAELFAAAKQVDGDATITHREGEEAPATEPVEDKAVHEAGAPADPVTEAAPPPPEEETHQKQELVRQIPAMGAATEEPAVAPAPDADAERLVARVRRLMLVSMAITVIAVGSVFTFIGYRIFKGEGSVEKKADKLPEASAVPNDVTLSLPRGARVVQSAVANDRLLITLEIGGKIEVRTFDVKTLQPTGRLDFSATP